MLLSSLMFYVRPDANNTRSFSIYVVCVYDKIMSVDFESLLTKDFLANKAIYQSKRRSLNIMSYDLTPGEEKKIDFKIVSPYKVISIYIICDFHQIPFDIAIPRKAVCVNNTTSNSFIISKNGITLA